jgi:hypothetical protein
MAAGRGAARSAAPVVLITDMNKYLPHAVFAAGLAAVAWVGAGYLGTNPLALAITALIAAVYLAGALELRRFRQATAALARAVADLPEALPTLRPWLSSLPPALQNAVRRRVEGEPVGLPGPSMTPYLAGLLVLLGMLGTFVGMVLTLRGTGLALESATDLQAVRASLVAPVRGLGLAFGTSIAGVAGSAMLGLLSALCRRERVQAAQALDARIATTLRVFSVVHQREASLQALQSQAALMPALVDGVQQVMAALERQAEASNARLLASQERFQGQAEAAYAGLAASIDRSLKETLVESARTAGATIQPVVEATMAGIARETAALHETLSQTFEQRAASLVEALAARQSALADTLAERQAGLADTLAQRQATLAGTLAERQAALVDTLTERQSTLVGSLAERQATLVDTLVQRQAEDRDAVSAALQQMTREAAAMQARIAETAAAQIDGVSARLDGTTQQMTDAWRDALAGHERASAQAAQDTQQALVQATQGTQEALASASSAFGQHAAALLRTVEQAHAELQQAAATRDGERLAAWTQGLGQMAASLREEWQQAGAQTLAQQREMNETMTRTAHDITTQAEAHASRTIAEIAQLVQAASEAPRAAAEVIAKLRTQLSDSMARDNALLDERARVVETLGTLLDAVNGAATEQRGAIDALVASSAAMLDRVGARFGEQVDAQTAQLAGVAAQVTGSAVEVASLGEAFGAAVQQFAQSNVQLVSQLERIEGALGASMSRSDDQLAYYVAQAREVVDLSILSQRQILEDLQRVAGRAAPVGAPA